VGRSWRELPYLLLRLNDWVGQVRQAARDAVADRITTDYIGPFVANLALVVRLERARRADLHGLLDRIHLLISSAEAVPALIQAMNSRNKEARRASFRLLVSREPDDLERRLRIALHADDPIIRLRAAAEAIERLEQTQLLPLLETMSDDTAAPVRLEALVAWVNRFPEQAGERLQGALLDRSAAVRAQARYYIRQREGMDFAQFYRDALATSQPDGLVVALSGLVETGSPADAAHIGSYLTHPSARVRRTAIRCVMTLGSDQFTHPVLERVFDDSTSVSRQAAVFLQPYAASIGATTLWALFELARSVHVRRSLLLLLARLPKWESVCYLVRAAAVGDHVTASWARERLRRWQARYNQGQTAPSGEQLDRLAAALSEAAAYLYEEDRMMLRFIVRTYSQK
jgi:HEAT repeat protein